MPYAMHKEVKAFTKIYAKWFSPKLRKEVHQLVHDAYKQGMKDGMIKGSLETKKLVIPIVEDLIKRVEKILKPRAPRKKVDETFSA